MTPEHAVRFANKTNQMVGPYRLLPPWMWCYGCGRDLTVGGRHLVCRCCNAPQASGCTHGGK